MERDGSETPGNPATMSLHVYNKVHKTDGFVTVQLLSSGTAVLSAAAYRIARNRLCLARVAGYVTGSHCDCGLSVEAGRCRKGANGETYVDPGYHWAVSIEGQKRPIRGTGFSMGDALARAKASAREDPNKVPVGINILKLTYDPKEPGKIPIARIVYGGTWNAEHEVWMDALHPSEVHVYPELQRQNPGHGEDSEPLEFPGPFSFDDTDEPPPRAG